jgi:hypothetical protein
MSRSPKESFNVFQRYLRLAMMATFADGYVDPLIVPIGPPWDRQDYFDPPDIDPLLKFKKSMQLNTQIVIFACKNYINSFSLS